MSHFASFRTSAFCFLVAAGIILSFVCWFGQCRRGGGITIVVGGRQVVLLLWTCLGIATGLLLYPIGVLNRVGHERKGCVGGEKGVGKRLLCVERNKRRKRTTCTRFKTLLHIIRFNASICYSHVIQGVKPKKLYPPLSQETYYRP